MKSSAVLGGREIHPINVRVGGFYQVAGAKRSSTPLAERLKWARDAALETVRWVAEFPFPDFERDYEFVALRHPDEYPFNEGRIVSNKGLDIAVRDYEAAFRRGAGAVLQRAALPASRTRCLLRRSAGALQPELRQLALSARQAAQRSRPARRVPQSVPEHHRARDRDPARLR